VFPQLYLPALIKLDQNRRLEVENNIRAGLARLRSLQHPSGGFAYWPGMWNIDGSGDWRNNWGTTYAGHFFLEAEKVGYKLPGDMKASWLRYQKDAAQQWNPRRGEPGGYASDLVNAERYAQAYRLYTLALAGAAEIGAMNRLRENESLTLAERWLLASAYQLAGKTDVARSMVEKDQLQSFVFADANPYTFGSLLRDRAVVLMGMTLLGRDAETGPLLEDVAGQLTDGSWYSTQSVAFALVAVAQNTGTKPFSGFSFDYLLGGTSKQTVASTAPLAHIKLTRQGANDSPLTLVNTSDRKLYATVAVRAIPRSGEEDASANGLQLDIRYSDADAKAIDVRRVAQGSDLIAQLTIKNIGKRPLDNLALSQLVPAGWEIRNDRLEGVEGRGERNKEKQPAAQFWWVPSEWRNHALRTAEFVDIRDDRVQRYFSLSPGESIFFETRLNAAYLGRFYLPGASVEAMYDATQHARQKGQWIEVVSARH
jgi:uncharacterized protein YfaS (alpha-2-macroglobulin family)